MPENYVTISALQECIQPYHDAFRPLLGIREGSGGRRQEATVTLIHDGSDRFAITAHHAVKDKGAKLIGVHASNATSWPEHYSILEPVGSDAPDPDLAWARARAADTDTVLSGGIPAALAISGFDARQDSAYLAVGYPASKGKVRMGPGTASSQLMVAVVEMTPLSAVEPVQLDERVHLAFAYSQTGRMNLSGAPALGAHPQGMSGGAVFALATPRTAISALTYVPFLVGILTQFHATPGILVAVRIRHLWEALGMQTSKANALYRVAGA